MGIFDVLLLFLVAGVVGGLGQTLAGRSRGGCLASVALGFIGALLGGWLARLLGLPEIFLIQVGPAPFPLVWSLIGATLFVALVGFVARRGASRESS